MHKIYGIDGNAVAMVHIKNELTNRGKKQPNIMPELIEHDLKKEL